MVGVRDAFLDLILGSRCVGCGRPGRALCRFCSDDLPSRARIAWPTPTPAGLAPPWATAEFSGTTRDLILALKERRCFAATAPLGWQLSRSVLAAAVGHGTDRRIVLVPVPSRASTVRQRGHDATYALTRRAAAEASVELGALSVAPLLALRSGVVDQAELTASDRATNVAGSMFVPSERLSRSLARSERSVRGDRVRRRPDDWLHGARSPTRTGGRRAGGGRYRDRCGHPSGGLSGAITHIPFASAIQRLASLYGVRLGPWLRRSGIHLVWKSGSASRCQSQAKRST